LLFPWVLESMLILFSYIIDISFKCFKYIFDLTWPVLFQCLMRQWMTFFLHKSSIGFITSIVLWYYLIYDYWFNLMKTLISTLYSIYVWSFYSWALVLYDSAWNLPFFPSNLIIATEVIFLGSRFHPIVPYFKGPWWICIILGERIMIFITIYITLEW
jgi:hypothetical protein